MTQLPRFPRAVVFNDLTSAELNRDPHLRWPIEWNYQLAPSEKYRLFISRVAERIERLGLRVNIEHDFDAFATETRRMDGYDEYVSPAFDPRYNDMSAERAFWLRVSEETGRLVACVAAKVFRFESAYDHIADLSIWYDRDPSLPHADETIEMMADTTRHIGGTVSMTGRMWTHPRWRKRGLSSYLPLMARTLLLSKYAVDFHFGLLSVELVKKQVWLTRYGFTRVEPCVRVKPLGSARTLDLWTVWMSQAELIADVDDAMSDG